MTGCTDGGKQPSAKLNFLRFGFCGAERRCNTPNRALSHPISNHQAFLIGERERFRTIRDGHWFLEISPLPTVPHASSDLPAVGKDRPVIQPVVNKPRLLLVMASGAFPHDDGQDVPEVSWRLIGRSCRGGGALRQSPGARQAPECGQEARSN